MSEYTNSGIVTVNSGANVPFTETPVKSNGCIVHRDGSGIVTLRGDTNQCRALYRVTFGGNLAIPDGGTVEAISAAISVSGEALNSSTVTVTPTATEAYSNIFTAALVYVPRGCCVTVGLSNISGQPISVANANMIVDRIA